MDIVTKSKLVSTINHLVELYIILIYLLASRSVKISYYVGVLRCGLVVESV